MVHCRAGTPIQFWKPALLNFGQVLQGIGGGGMITLIAVIFSDVIPLKERGLWQGYLNILYAIGMSIGAPLGKQSNHRSRKVTR